MTMSVTVVSIGDKHTISITLEKKVDSGKGFLQGFPLAISHSGHGSLGGHGSRGGM